MKKFATLALVLFTALPTMAAVTLPYTFTGGSTIPAAQVNANFSAVADELNAHEALTNPHQTTLQDILQVGNSCGGTPIDFNDTQALNFILENVPSNPASGNAGRLVFNTGSGTAYLDTGSGFVPFAGSGSNPLSTVLVAGNSAGSTNIDMNEQMLLHARAENLSSLPGAGHAGRMVFDTTNATFFIDNGSAWVTVGGGGISYGVDSGSANAYVLASPAPAVGSLAAGTAVSFIPANANTGASTINVGGLGAVNLLGPGAGTLGVGTLSTTMVALAVYDGTEFQLVNPLAKSSSVANAPVTRDGSGNFSGATISATTFSGSGSSLTGITNSNLSGTAGVANANLATMANNTAKANISGSTTTPSDVPVTISGGASSILATDTNANTQVNEILQGFATTATAGATTTLTIASPPIQSFTGSSTQTVQLPTGSTLTAGWQYLVENSATGAVTITDSAGSTVCALPHIASYSFAAIVSLINNSGNGTWQCGLLIGTSSTTPVIPTAFGGTGLSTVGSQFQAFVMGASTPGWGAISLNQSSTAVTGVLGVGNGGTGASSVTVSPTASSWSAWDANSNLSANNHIQGYAATATAAGTTTLTVASAHQEYFTGSTTQTVKLPVVATGPLPLGFAFTIVNLSSGTVTVQSSGANTLQAMGQNTQLVATSIAQSGTGTAAWNWQYTSVQNSLSGGGTVTSVTFTGDGVIDSATPSSAVTTSGTVTATVINQAKNTFLAGPSSGSNAAPTFRAQAYADVSPALKLPNVVTFTSSGTYTPSSSPAPLYAIIECIGAGGGGGASGTGGGTGGSAGGTTTFGSFISITGGALGGDGDGPSPGGVPTLTTSGTAIAIYSVAGGQGQGSPAGALNVGGGQGGSSFLGGGGGGGEFGAGTAGGNGATNSGGGGGGAGSTTGLTSSGSGGGGGGFGKMLLTGASIASTAVTLGNGGTGQTAGSSGQAGGNGAKGQCTVMEYFQ